jgi:hypothetical protein
MEARLQYGPPLADLSTVVGSVRTDEETVVEDAEVTDEVATCRRIVRELSSSANFVAGLTPSLGALSPHLLAELGTKLRQEVVNESIERSTIRRRKTLTIRQKLTIEGRSGSEPIYLVSTYQKVGFDVYLSFFDYLTVRYQRSGAQVRHRRIKVPPAPTDGRNSWLSFGNVSEPLNVPVMTLWMWRFIEHRYPLLEAGYDQGVDDPHHVAKDDLNVEMNSRRRLADPDEPSLYYLSNAAFPLKWDRRFAESPE